MARPPRDPSLLSWPWVSAPSGSGGPSSAVGLTSLPIVNSHALQWTSGGPFTHRVDAAKLERNKSQTNTHFQRSKFLSEWVQVSFARAQLVSSSTPIM